MFMETMTEAAILVRQIKAADWRCADAWDKWDAEAYEGAANSGERYYKQLVALVGAEKAQEMVTA